MVKTIGNILTEEDIQNIVTKDDIKEQLIAMGIQRGMLLFVDANSDNLGYLVGGTQSFIEALMDCVGYDGTIVMPSFTMQKLDPACHDAIPVERAHWDKVRENTASFHRKLDAPYHADALVYQFLRNEGVVRSYHPLYSFAAWGKYAKIICDKHPLHFGMSKESPLGKLSELNGFVLLVGCGYDACTMFHLARYTGEQLPIKIQSAPIKQNNKIVWKDMLDLSFNNHGFATIGEIMEERKVVKSMYINSARCRFFSAREAVTIATAYFHI